MQIKNNLHLFKGNVYDLGCGIRPYEAEILSVADAYTGIDWSDTLHDLRADIIADLNTFLPVENEVADTVASFQVLEHLVEPLTMLKEANRILKKEGKIIITVPFQWWVHESPYDYYRYTHYGLKSLLSKAGFKSIEVEPCGGFFITAILKMNYFSRRFCKIGPKPVRGLIRTILIFFWFTGQVIAPLLDRLDKEKELEATGYMVTASK